MFRLKKQLDRISPTHAPIEIHLVRHAEALSDCGMDSHGPALTPLGIKQARLIAKHLAKQRYTAIYSSDLTRARQTADAIATRHRNALLTLTRDLREVAGDHTNLDMSRTTEHSDRSILEEKCAMHRVVTHLRHEHTTNDHILVVAHGNIIRSLIPMLCRIHPCNAPLFEIHNTSLSIVDLWPSGRAVVRLVNCTSHLPKRMVT